MKEYIQILKDVIDGDVHENRTSQNTRRVWGKEFRHDLSQGFPLLTTKKMAYKACFAELIGFLRGETDVRWYRSHGCRIWDSDHKRWHTKDLERDISVWRVNGDPLLEESIKHRTENPFSLGEIYGYQWRNFANSGYDQLAQIVSAIRDGSNSRRLIMSAWAPNRFHMMCLPPCHVSYHFVIDGCRLNIMCYQRSCDTPLGVPFNIASTALLCHIVANSAGLFPGEMVWYGDDVHIYENQVGQAEKQIKRKPMKLPRLLLAEEFKDPWEVEVSDISVLDYNHHGRISFPLTVS